ncbi:hypothetical protein Q6D67_09665 [Haliea sp. E1-2-M8]|uniref:hypothetical protein n=1 Tax=Haliea sp. E1-2-M8 TaxID=3064706 RepID=UPI0027177037|nr:hypothetical protein [Haliea sp. E1-2-M8]MDO8861969.1 hypothetical protein [Haliea sp. E1-2-M8]
MDEAAKLRVIRARTRRRFVFTGITLVLYFSFVLNWTAVGDSLAERLGASHVTGSLLMFVSLVIFFILLELVFLVLNQATTRSGEES